MSKEKVLGYEKVECEKEIGSAMDTEIEANECEVGEVAAVFYELGFHEGCMRSFVEDYMKAYESGYKAAQKQIAKTMLIDGMEVEDIKCYTGLKKKKIHKILKKM